VLGKLCLAQWLQMVAEALFKVQNKNKNKVFYYYYYYYYFFDEYKVFYFES